MTCPETMAATRLQLPRAQGVTVARALNAGSDHHRREHSTETCLRGRKRPRIRTTLGSKATCRGPRPNPAPTLHGHEALALKVRYLRSRRKRELNGNHLTSLPSRYILSYTSPKNGFESLAGTLESYTF